MSATTPGNWSPADVHALLEAFEGSDWSALQLTMDGLELSVSRDGVGTELPAPTRWAPLDASTSIADGAVTSPPPSVTPPVTAAAHGASALTVHAGTVGTFYTAPSPGAEPFTSAGATVAAGDQIAIIEVMKLMTPVHAPRAGHIAEVCVADGQLVEFDQPLFVIE